MFIEETEELPCFDKDIHVADYYRPCEKIIQAVSWFPISSLLAPYWLPIGSLSAPYWIPIGSLLDPYQLPIDSLVAP